MTITIIIVLQYYNQVYNLYIHNITRCRVYKSSRHLYITGYYSQCRDVSVRTRRFKQ
jgi:hypothetical protein